MPTPVAPIGAPFGPRTNESAGSLTRTCAPRLRRAERPRSGLVLGLLRVGIQLALAGDASAPGHISDGPCADVPGSPLLALKPVVASHHTTTFGIVD